MIDEKNTAAPPRWLRTAAWAAVICALPLGVVNCGQPDATGSPGGETAEAADVVADGAVQADADNEASADRRTARLNELRRDLRARVAAGEITEEQARQRASRILHRLESGGGETAGDKASSDQPSEGDGTARIDQLRRDLRAKVAAGEITAEQARQRISRAVKRLEASRGKEQGGTMPTTAEEQSRKENRR